MVMVAPMGVAVAVLMRGVITMIVVMMLTPVVIMIVMIMIVVIMIMVVVIVVVVRLGHAPMSHRERAGSMRLEVRRPTDERLGASGDTRKSR